MSTYRWLRLGVVIVGKTTGPLTRQQGLTSSGSSALRRLNTINSGLGTSSSRLHILLHEMSVCQGEGTTLDISEIETGLNDNGGRGGESTSGSEEFLAANKRGSKSDHELLDHLKLSIHPGAQRSVGVNLHGAERDPFTTDRNIVLDVNVANVGINVSKGENREGFADSHGQFDLGRGQLGSCPVKPEGTNRDSWLFGNHGQEHGLHVGINLLPPSRSRETNWGRKDNRNRSLGGNSSRGSGRSGSSANQGKVSNIRR
jgi:hypothetical protein